MIYSLMDIHAANTPQSATRTPAPEPAASMARTTLMLSLSATWPNTTWWLLSQGVGLSVMKNCEPLVLAPRFAIDKMPWPTCWHVKASSWNCPPYMLYPPMPFPNWKSLHDVAPRQGGALISLGSHSIATHPPWTTKPGTMRCMLLPL